MDNITNLTSPCSHQCHEFFLNRISGLAFASLQIIELVNHNHFIQTIWSTVISIFVFVLMIWLIIMSSVLCMELPKKDRHHKLIDPI